MPTSLSHRERMLSRLQEQERAPHAATAPVADLVEFPPCIAGPYGNIWLASDVRRSGGRWEATCAEPRIIASTSPLLPASERARWDELLASAPTLYANDKLLREIIAELVAALQDTVRMLEAVRLSAGLGKSQIERLERARAALAKAASFTAGACHEG